MVDRNLTRKVRIIAILLLQWDIAKFTNGYNASSSSLSLSRVAVVGNVDAGKSTLLGVLTHGVLDNGRGYARQRLFRHKHEMESGRTCSVGRDK